MKEHLKECLSHSTGLVALCSCLRCARNSACDMFTMKPPLKHCEVNDFLCLLQTSADQNTRMVEVDLESFEWSILAVLYTRKSRRTVGLLRNIEQRLKAGRKYCLEGLQKPHAEVLRIAPDIQPTPSSRTGFQSRTHVPEDYEQK